MTKAKLVSLLFVAFLFSLLSQSITSADSGDDVCGDDQTIAPNIVSTNCRFEGTGNNVDGYGLVRTGWNPFIVSGTPHFDTLDTHNGYNWLPAHQGDQKIDTMGKPWSAGVWQMVNNVIPGHGYRAEAGWVVSQNTLAEGRIGIDPTGGTDPNSPNIVWSRPIKLCGAMRCRHIVQAYAANTTISVWMQVTIATPIGSDNCWITAVAVKTDATMPTATPTNTATPRPTATNTRPPPTRTPTAVPATATPTDTATPTVTDTPTPSLTPTPTDTDTPTPTATRRPTSTPSPTPTPASLLGLGRDAVLVQGGLLAAGVAGTSGCAFLMALVAGGLFVLLRQKH